MCDPFHLIGPFQIVLEHLWEEAVDPQYSRSRARKWSRVIRNNNSKVWNRVENLKKNSDSDKESPKVDGKQKQYMGWREWRTFPMTSSRLWATKTEFSWEDTEKNLRCLNLKYCFEENIAIFWSWPFPSHMTWHGCFNTMIRVKCVWISFHSCY
jgi:hypothetical protein